MISRVEMDHHVIEVGVIGEVLERVEVRPPSQETRIEVMDQWRMMAGQQYIDERIGK